MFYDYSSHIKELEDDPQKKEDILDPYIHYYGRQDNMDIYDTAFYKDYLEKFEVPFFIVCPEDLEDDFDWFLLAKMTVASFSSEYKLKLDEEWKKNPKGCPKVHIYITVESKGESITKDIEELWSFQVLRLYEIYAEEQMKLFTELAEENEKAEKYEDFSEDQKDDENDVVKEQKKKLIQYQKNVDLLMREARNTCRLMNFL